jgi:hypothetical protein
VKQRRHHLLDWLRQQVQEARADDCRPRSEAEERRLFIDLFVQENPRLFGVDDPRADRANLETLTLDELCEVYKEMMQADIEAWKANNPPERAAFLELSVEEKIRILTNNAEWHRWCARWK